jgi:hypothetical protein
MGIMRSTDSWVGLTIAFSRRLAPPCSTITAPAGSAGRATWMSLGASST